MVIRIPENRIAAKAFLLGIIVSILIGALAGTLPGFNVTPFVIGVISVIGIIVGFFVAEENSQTFLLASVSLVIVSSMSLSGLFYGSAAGGVYSLGKFFSSVMQSLLALFVPATIVVAIKTVFSISKN
jgi:hypothetical protein